MRSQIGVRLCLLSKFPGCPVNYMCLKLKNQGFKKTLAKTALTVKCALMTGAGSASAITRPPVPENPDPLFPDTFDS